MAPNGTKLWESLENWMPSLFVVAGLFSLIAAANYGVTEFVDNISFNYWVGLTVLLARVSSLLAVAGLSVGILGRHRNLGRLSRAVVSLALLFTAGLLTTAVLKNLGTETPLEAVFGLGTVALSLATYSLFGAAILRTDSHATQVGALLFGAVAALLFGLFGKAFFTTGVVGTVAESVLFVTHVAIGYKLQTRATPGDQTELTSDTVME